MVWVSCAYCLIVFGLLFGCIVVMRRVLFVGEWLGVMFFSACGIGRFDLFALWIVLVLLFRSVSCVLLCCLWWLLFCLVLGCLRLCLLLVVVYW